MNRFVPLALVALLPLVAAGPAEDLPRDAECGSAAHAADVVIAWGRATPGRVVAEDTFHSGNPEVAVDPCVRSGGTITIRHLDTLVPHYPVSEEEAGVYDHCIDHVGDTGHWMRLGDAYALTLRYDPTIPLVELSVDGGTTWRDCSAAVGKWTGAWAAIPWHCYLYPQSVAGVLLVAAS